MRNNAFFQSTLFENKDPKPHFINPCCFGEDVVTWLLENLRPTGLQLGDSIQEDYGWGFWVEGDYWVPVGIMEDSIGADVAEWRLSVDYDPGLSIKKRLFGKADPVLQLRICQAINSALQGEPGITALRWCNDAETDCGETPW